MSEQKTEEELQLLKSIEDNPDSIRNRQQLATYLRDQGRWNDGIEVLDECISIAPANIHSYRMRANFLLKTGHSTEAARTAMRALELAPESIHVYLLAVRMQLANLQPGKAQQLLDQALCMDPEHAHLKQMKALQQRIVSMTAHAEHNPLKWLSRKFNRRIQNVAKESKDA